MIAHSETAMMKDTHYLYVVHANHSYCVRLLNILRKFVFFSLLFGSSDCMDGFMRRTLNAYLLISLYIVHETAIRIRNMLFEHRFLYHRHCQHFLFVCCGSCDKIVVN